MAEFGGSVSALLRGPYPFPRPALRSEQRGKRKTPGRPAGVAKDKLRRLEPGETGYRVTYRQQGQIRVETHDAPDALRTLLAAQGAQLEVQLIETVDATGATKAVLHGATP